VVAWVPFFNLAGPALDWLTDISSSDCIAVSLAILLSFAEFSYTYHLLASALVDLFNARSLRCRGVPLSCS